MAASPKCVSTDYTHLTADWLRLAYKIISGKEKIDPGIFFTPSHTKNLRGNRYKLFKKTCNLQLRDSFFSQRVVNDWNNLPDTVVSAPTVNSFKSRLDKFLKNERWNNSEGWCRWFHYPTSTSTSSSIQLQTVGTLHYFILRFCWFCVRKSNCLDSFVNEYQIPFRWFRSNVFNNEHGLTINKSPSYLVCDSLCYDTVTAPYMKTYVTSPINGCRWRKCFLFTNIKFFFIKVCKL